MAEVITVPVVAHRLFGSRMATAEPRRRSGTSWDWTAREDLLAGALSLRFPVIDRDHGTRRSLEEIHAMFVPDPALEHTAGFTVNEIWEPADLRFEVVGTQDHMIASHHADLLPLHGEAFDRNEMGRRLAWPGMLNVYFVRSIVRAWGAATLRSVSALRPDGGLAFVADRQDTEAHVGPTERFRGEVVTLAHELGHVLGLPHMPERANVMYGNGTITASEELLVTQRAIARYRARFYGRPARDPLPHVPWDRLPPPEIRFGSGRPW